MDKFPWGLLSFGWVLVVGLVLGVAPVRAQEVFRCDLEQIVKLGEKLRREGSLTLSAPEAEVNRCLVRYQAQIQRQTPFQSVDVDFRPGEVDIRGHWAWFSIVASIEPYVDQGRVYVRLQKVRLGFLPLPAFLFRAPVSRVNAELERFFQRPPLSYVEVQEVVVTEEGLIVTMTLRK